MRVSALAETRHAGLANWPVGFAPKPVVRSADSHLDRRVFADLRAISATL